METMSDPNPCTFRPEDSDCMFCRNLKNCKRRNDGPPVSAETILRHAYPPD